MSDTEAPPQNAGTLVKMLVVAALVGLAAGAAVIVFLTVEHELQNLLWTTIPDAMGGIQAWWVFLVLLTGAVGVWAVEKLPGNGGHRPLDGLSMNIGPREITSVVLAALISLSVGAVVGPEAPLMAIGSAVGAAFATRANEQVRKLFMMAGSVAAITMILGNPMISAVLLLEAVVLKGSPGGRKVMMGLLPILIAMGFGYVIQVGFGGWSGVGESKLGVPGLPDYPAVQAVDLAVGLLVALATAILAVFAVEAGTLWQNRIRKPLLGLLISAAIVATAAVATYLITGESLDVILFSGESATGVVLGITSISALLVIAVAKTIGYAVSLGGGFRGGMVFPAVFLGVVVATAAANMVSSSNVSALASAGIAAAVAGVMRLPFTAVLLALLLCSPAGLAVTTTAIIGAVVGVIVRGGVDMRMSKESDTVSVE